MRPSTSREKESRKRVFKTGFRKYSVLAVPALAMAAVFFLLGFRYYPTARFDPASSFLYVVPWGVGVFIVALTLFGWLSNAGKQVIVTLEGLEYLNYGKGFKVSWGDLVFTPPRADKIYLKTAVIGNGERYERLEEFFLPEFQKLVEVIRLGKKHAREERQTVNIDI